MSFSVEKVQRLRIGDDRASFNQSGIPDEEKPP